MKARHKYLDDHKSLQDTLPELRQYGQIRMLSNTLAFTFTAGFCAKVFSKKKFTKHILYNVGLVACFPLIAVVGHWQDEQSKIAEKALHDHINLKFQSKPE
ncbi:unnamed protein product [Paramecium primaurelia]|uniref:Uncharacterized protein n=2 Tax=Paramecium TaxID=5884 RepID=A0A8S1W0H3_9CILI|nr:unnamed protein product [Paramecium primaurelia]CAD8182277.1 unnamed protein product [Paramecium pentaurelia]